MRLNYYRFPEDTSEDVLLQNGCGVILKSGDIIYVDNIPDDKRCLVECVDKTTGPVTITQAKKLLREYGGVAWTEHFERDGCLFETTQITLTGNNSRHKYNRHL